MSETILRVDDPLIPDLWEGLRSAGFAYNFDLGTWDAEATAERRRALKKMRFVRKGRGRD